MSRHPIDMSRHPIDKSKVQMKTNNTVCTECGGAMEEGFLLDETPGGRHPVYWIGEAPESSYWFGVQVKKKEIWITESHRCSDCGFLKTYARKRKN